MAKKKLNFDIKKHVLVPKHTVCSEAEKKRVLERYNITAYDLPLIFKADPAIASLETKPGDIIKHGFAPSV